MKCPYCQAENREEALFCGDCGRKIQNITPLQRKLLLLGLVCFAIGIFAYTLVESQRKFSAFLRQGEAALKRDKPEEAMFACKSALALKPANAEAKSCADKALNLCIEKLTGKGKQLMAGQKYTEAIKAFREALSLGAGADINNLLAAAEKLQAKREAAEARAKVEAEARAEAKAKAKAKATAMAVKAEAACNKGICNWYAAMTYCKIRGSRLPTVNELKNMYQAECTGGQQADTCNKWYWSSEESGSGSARYVFFNYGDVGTISKDTYTSYVRCR